MESGEYRDFQISRYPGIPELGMPGMPWNGTTNCRCVRLTAPKSVENANKIKPPKAKQAVHNRVTTAYSHFTFMIYPFYLPRLLQTGRLLFSSIYRN
jgi:hypothetical protein